MQPVIYTRIPRCDAALIAEIGQFPVSDLHEAMGAIAGRGHLMTPRMRPIATGQRMVGQAITSNNYPGDNLMIHAALNVAQAGDVLVLSNGGLPQGALWGDVAATYAAEKGVAGLIIDGPVRDTEALRQMGCKVWASIVSPSHPEKRGPGAVNVPLACDGVQVIPGDIIVADDDGVLVVPVRLAVETIRRARQRNETEARIRREIKAGSSLFEIVGIQKFLDAAGVRTVDAEWSPPQG